MHLRTLPAWSARFEVPDVVHYADFVAEPEESLAVFRMVPASNPEPIRFLQYPKGNGGFRSMGLATLRELVYLRVAAGYVGLATERFVGPEAYSGRFSRRPPDWRFQTNAYKGFQMAAAARATAWDCDLMVRTDMRSYYASVPVERLARMLIDAKALYGPTSFLLERVMWWQDHCGLQGLPVGPEACAIPGTAYLAPLDGLLRRVAANFYRYTDDVIYFSNRGTLFEEVDAVLEDLGLQRSIGKTNAYMDPVEAREAIRRRSLDYLGGMLDRSGKAALRKIRAAFEEEVAHAAKVDVTSFRWLLRSLGNHNDAFAVDSLLSRLELMNLDPRTSAEYLAKAGWGIPDTMDRVIGSVASGRSDNTDALRVHLMKLASDKDAGTGGRRVFETLAENEEERSDVRAWGWKSAGQCGGFSADRAFDAAMEERDELVSRAAVLTLRGKDVKSKRWLTNEYARRHPINRPAAVWAGAA